MPRTVLLADDSVTAQNMGRRILTDAGYDVITVNNGSAALKKIHENPPDLIVLDVYMPGYGGLEVCQRLKESGDTMKIPVLLTVGKMEPFKTDDAKRVAADGHIVKPFDATELLAALTRLEDRIVPQSAPAQEKRSEKTRWFWHGEEPAPASEPAKALEKRASPPEIKNGEDERSFSAAPSEAAAEPAATANAASGELAKPGRGMFSSSAPLSPDFFTAETLELPIRFALDAVNSRLAAQAPVKPEPAVESPGHEFSVEQEPDAVAGETAGLTPVEEDQSPEPEAVALSSPNAVRWVAEKVELTAEEAALSLEEEMRRQEAATATGENQSEMASNLAEREPSQPNDESGEASLAARAAAGAAASPAAESLTPEAINASAHQASAEQAAALEPKLADQAQAAWENWQQIGESVAQPGEAKASESTQAGLNGHAEESAAQPGLEDTALASIVDSVLAELKPRLMQEIAKKLSQDKK